MFIVRHQSFLATHTQAEEFSQLIESGGWLGDLIPMISNLTGIWDIFLLVFIWVIGWVVIREIHPLPSMVMALVFDVSIPLQHQRKSISTHVCTR
jgi:hypothetical protein